MNRPQNWPEMLDEYLQQRLDKPFAWAIFDCATFAAGWLEQMTGRAWFPPYTDAGSAAKFIQESGGIGAVAASIIGNELPNPKTAQRGDIALIDHEGRESLGIVRGSDVIGPGATGLMAIPRRAILRAWRI